MEDWRVVAQIIQVLEQNQIPYAIVSGYSAMYWGRPRFTHDADLLVDLKLSQVNLLVNAFQRDLVVSPEAIREAIQHCAGAKPRISANVNSTTRWASTKFKNVRSIKIISTIGRAPST